MSQAIQVNQTIIIINNQTVQHIYPNTISITDLYHQNPSSAISYFIHIKNIKQLFIDSLSSLFASLNINHSLIDSYTQFQSIHDQTQMTHYLQSLLSPPSQPTLDQQKLFVASILDNDKSIKSLTKLNQVIASHFKQIPPSLYQFSTQVPNDLSIQSIYNTLKTLYPFIFKSFLIKNRITEQSLFSSNGEVQPSYSYRPDKDQFYSFYDHQIENLYTSPKAIDFVSISNRKNLFKTANELVQNKENQVMLLEENNALNNQFESALTPYSSQFKKKKNRPLMPKIRIENEQIQSGKPTVSPISESRLKQMTQFFNSENIDAVEPQQTGQDTNEQNGQNTIEQQQTQKQNNSQDQIASLDRSEQIQDLVFQGQRIVLELSFNDIQDNQMEEEKQENEEESEGIYFLGSQLEHSDYQDKFKEYKKYHFDESSMTLLQKEIEKKSVQVKKVDELYQQLKPQEKKMYTKLLVDVTNFINEQFAVDNLKIVVYHSTLQYKDYDCYRSEKEKDIQRKGLHKLYTLLNYLIKQQMERLIYVKKHTYAKNLEGFLCEVIIEKPYKKSNGAYIYGESFLVNELLQIIFPKQRFEFAQQIIEHLYLINDQEFRKRFYRELKKGQAQ